MKSSEEISIGEDRLRSEVIKLNDSDRLKFYRELSKQLKDPDTYAALNYVFFLGIHHAYLGRWLAFFIHTACIVVVIIAFMKGNPIAASILFFLVVYDLYELFLSQRIVAEANNRITANLLIKYKTNKI
jgi:hypothetical protein